MRFGPIVIALDVMWVYKVKLWWRGKAKLWLLHPFTMRRWMRMARVLSSEPHLTPEEKQHLGLPYGRSSNYLLATYNSWDGYHGA